MLLGFVNLKDTIPRYNPARIVVVQGNEANQAHADPFIMRQDTGSEKNWTVLYFLSETWVPKNVSI